MQKPSPHNAICRECEYAGRSVKPREFRGFDMRRIDRTANTERVALQSIWRTRDLMREQN